MSSIESLNEFEKFIQKQLKETDELKADVIRDYVLAEPSHLHNTPAIDVLLHNQLMLESELEALLKTDLKLLPDDKDILINLAEEEAQSTSLETSRALDYQKEVNKKLEEEVAKLEKLCKKAESIDSKLSNLVENKHEVNQLGVMTHKYGTYSIAFHELRKEFNEYLQSRYSLGDDEKASIEEILEEITKKFFEDPNDPYVKFDYNEHNPILTILLKASIIMRNPVDATLYKLVDYRND